MEYFDGVRTYIEESQPGEWIHVVDAADGERTYIYRDRAKRDSEVYARNVSPQAGGAPLRIGTRDLLSGDVAYDSAGNHNGFIPIWIPP
jgi:hypothetical protein